MRKLIVFMAAFFALSGCGYRAVNMPSGGARTISVDFFTDRSFRANLVPKLADALTDSFARRSGAWTIVSAGGERRLTGTIVSYTAVPAAFSGKDRIAEYRGVLKIEAVMNDASGNPLWRRQFSAEGTWPVNAEIALQQSSEEAAIRRLCGMIAEEVYVASLDGF